LANFAKHTGCELRASGFEQPRTNRLLLAAIAPSVLPSRSTSGSLNRLHLLDQRSQHSLHFVHLFPQYIKLCIRQKIEIASEQQMILKLCSRTTGNVQKPRQLAI
jgi:hypothetical protein